MGQGNRRQRVANAMRPVLAEFIAREVKDPRVHAAGLVSVSQVELNRDLSVAFVYVSFLASDDERAVTQAMAGLTAAAGFLRGPVGRRLKLQRAPQLRFMRDPRAAFGERMREIIRDDTMRAQASGSASSDDAPAPEPELGPTDKSG